MISDAIIMEKGMRSLVESLGEVNAERFITRLIREPFDYTKWQRNLFESMSIEEISGEAVRYCKENPR
ncbi:MAG: hypothetical protein FWG87_00695 [Defluviitaleaceae bacterium]|nr:hypothetical protein [Defluviitaleaceae bacterium]